MPRPHRARLDSPALRWAFCSSVAVVVVGFMVAMATLCISATVVRKGSYALSPIQP